MILLETVAETPVNPITSAGVIEPTAEVADMPVGIIIGFDEILISPISIVAETPVIPNAKSGGVIEPTAEVAAIPVSPITSVVDSEPTDDVAEIPVGVTVTFPIIVADPILAVEETPVNPITSAGAIDPTLAAA